jgi:predicted unusual protein kinase regulating ubiquinone biosynthesis (AarF/ABC1/UbiB family)
MLRLAEHRGTLDERSFHADIERAYYQYMVYATNQTSFAALMNAILNILSAHGLRLNQDLTLAIKAIMQGEVIALTLQPHLLWSQVAFDEATSLLGEQFTTERIIDTVKTQAMRTAKELLREMPNLQDATAKWLDQYRLGRFVVELNTSALAESVEHFSQSIRRVTVALILVGMTIGSAIASSLLISFQNTQWAFLPMVAMGIFLATVLFSVVVVIHMRSTERVDKQ